MRTRIKYSQNFLKDAGLIKRLIEKSSINKDDVVYEIGAGNGIITNELIKYCKKVAAFEIDKNLSNKLIQRFQDYKDEAPRAHVRGIFSSRFVGAKSSEAKNSSHSSTSLRSRFSAKEDKVEIISSNFLDYRLPNTEYKVFSNIPFNITASVVKKLIFSNYPPVDSYLILQKEAANKFIGKPLAFKNSLISVLIKMNFELSIFYEFQRNDFFPQPRVAVVMLRLKKRELSLVKSEQINIFYDFVSFCFVHGKIPYSHTKPSQLEIDDWAKLFEKFLKAGKELNIKGSYHKLLNKETLLQKIHRTRVDKNWKRIRRY